MVLASYWYSKKVDFFSADDYKPSLDVIETTFDDKCVTPQNDTDIKLLGRGGVMFHPPLRGVKYHPPLIRPVMMVGMMVTQIQNIVLCQRAPHQLRFLFLTRAK